jgi:signal transduction histidine kinase/CheY-like chemotaxis protein
MDEKKPKWTEREASSDPTSTAVKSPMTSASLVERIFAGKGEMARLIRATDWSQTPLGPIEAWPQSLRTAVSLCLGSRHPIVLWWGPERWMFYNDAYRPMLGESKHPHFLGRRGQECWAEIWSIIGPMMDQVIETGVATWSEDLGLLMRRFGYLEETYFTFSYSPIIDEHGQVSGIFNACTESTRRVLGDRRVKMLREMAVEARTVRVAACLCAEILGRNPHDVPFALIYLLDEPGQCLRLTAQTGLEPGTAASPLSVEVQRADDTGWPLSQVTQRQRPELLRDLERRFDCLPRGAWGEPAHQALLLPIPRPGSSQVAGVLVLGISPRRAFDDDYRGFFDLVAGHVTTALSNARAYEQERERAEKLAELDRAKTAFFANVSHEFRTPLTLMLGPLEDALGEPTKALRDENLEAVHRNALRLLRLVNSMLDFSRVEASRLESRFEPTDLAQLTSGLAASFRSLVESGDLKLSLDCPALPELAYVDRAHWEKIVLNLLSNAFKFTLQGEITVTLAIVRDRFELSVKDTGSGIPQAELTKVFERFHRVQGVAGRSFEGSGIGLALVQELVRQHAGSVRVDSVLGRGSNFVVSIPRGKSHLPEQRVFPGRGLSESPLNADAFLFEAAHWGVPPGGSLAPAATSSALASTASGHPFVSPSEGRVLVAEDNADMRDYLARLLASRWTVEAVANGRQALELALSRPPDLVLSDAMMPEMDGVSLLKALRKNAKTRTIPVVMLSARAGEEAVVAGLDTGADDYIVKPFSARELISRVATHLELARLRQSVATTANELAETRAALRDELAHRQAGGHGPH